MTDPSSCLPITHFFPCSGRACLMLAAMDRPDIVDLGRVIHIEGQSAISVGWVTEPVEDSDDMRIMMAVVVSSPVHTRFAVEFSREEHGDWLRTAAQADGMKVKPTVPGRPVNEIETISISGLGYIRVALACASLGIVYSPESAASLREAETG